MVKHKIVAGNWKMNKDYHQALELVNDLTNILSENKPNNTIIVLSPPFPFLKDISDLIKDFEFIKLGAQNCSNRISGAYTGEVSAEMLASIGVEYCIVGHSERRQLFFETDEIVLEKINLLLQNNIKPIYCCGEKLEERESNKYFEVIEKQIKDSILKLDASQIINIVIAYEPVWAIGTGKTASTLQAGEMHTFIFKLLENQYGREIAEKISILYGGSCNASNAKELFNTEYINGGLIGGASLKPEDFIKIIYS